MTDYINYQRLSDPLGRYYTSPSVGDILIDSIRGDDPNYVLDLGAGTGTLSKAASRRWANAKILAVDIDSYSKDQIELQKLNQHTGSKFQHHIADALGDDLHKTLGISLGDIDVSVCNPPYLKSHLGENVGKILEAAGLSDAFDRIRDATSDVLFLAQNLRMLKKWGQLGLIVPDGLISGEKYRLVRKYLVEKHDIECCIRLPRGSFKRTDAQAHILLINKEKTQSNRILLRDFDGFSLTETELYIDPQDAVDRLDYGYYSGMRKYKIWERPKNKFDGTIFRGRQSSAQVKSSEEFIFHTSNFPKQKDGVPWFSYQRKPGMGLLNPTSGTVAKSGDILVARVHRNLEEKICIVRKGRFLISDCVFRVRLHRGCPLELVNFLHSGRGKDLLVSISSGVSARQISKASLSKAIFPVEVLHDRRK